MAGYDQAVKIRSKFQREARDFLNFLQKVGKRYSRSVKIKYRYLGRGRFYVMVDGGADRIDALFQELLLNKGLYYYACTLHRKGEVISQVILPMFRQLIDNRFDNSQSRFLRKHILGKYSQVDFIPTNIRNKHGYSFEILFRKWDLKMISNKDYLIDLDAIIHSFALEKIGHIPGEKSDKLQKLLHKLKRIYFLDSEALAAFEKIHKIRTGSLHRLIPVKAEESLYDISYVLFRYFQYLDEFDDSQKQKTIKWKGKRFKRIRYGDEKQVDKNGQPYLDDDGKPMDWIQITKDNDCHDCGVKRGEYHVGGCDVEECPRCGGQMICYDCGLPDDD